MGPKQSPVQEQLQRSIQLSHGGVAPTHGRRDAKLPGRVPGHAAPAIGAAAEPAAAAAAAVDAAEPAAGRAHWHSGGGSARRQHVRRRRSCAGHGYASVHRVWAERPKIQLGGGHNHLHRGLGFTRRLSGRLLCVESMQLFVRLDAQPRHVQLQLPIDRGSKSAVQPCVRGGGQPVAAALVAAARAPSDAAGRRAHGHRRVPRGRPVVGPRGLPCCGRGRGRPVRRPRRIRNREHNAADRVQHCAGHRTDQVCVPVAHRGRPTARWLLPACQLRRDDVSHRVRVRGGRCRRRAHPRRRRRRRRHRRRRHCRRASARL